MNTIITGDYAVRKGPRDKSWSASVSVPLDKLTSEMIERLAMHGLHQKVADAASQSTSETEAMAAMQKAVDAILADEWTSRRAGDGVDPFTAEARLIVRPFVKASMGGKSPAWAAFIGLGDDEQAAKLDKVFADNDAKLRPLVEASLERKAKERADKAKLAGGLDITI